MNHLSVPRPLLVMAVVLLLCVMNSKQRKKETDLRIVIYTSDKDWAGTDDNVYVNIIGAKGQTDKIRLDNPGDDFPKAGVDIYTLTTYKIGIPSKIEVWGGEGGDSWHLSKMEVEMNDERYLYESTLFDCGTGDECWFTTAAETKRVLTKHNMMIKRKWKVTTYTGDRGGSYTKDATWIQFNGNNGSSDFIALNKQGSFMPKKSSVIYRIAAWDYIGELHTITMMAARNGDSWQLMRVEAETFINETRWMYVFDCGGKGKWIFKTQMTLNLTSKESRFP